MARAQSPVSTARCAPALPRSRREIDGRDYLRAEIVNGAPCVLLSTSAEVLRLPMGFPSIEAAGRMCERIRAHGSVDLAKWTTHEHRVKL